MTNVQFTVEAIDKATTPIKNIEKTIEKSFKNVEKSTKQLEGTMGGLSQTFKGTFGALAAFDIAGKIMEGVVAIPRLADEFNNLQNSIKQVTDENNLDNLTQDILAVANRARAPIQETGSAFVRFDKTIQALGGTQSESLLLTENLAKGLSLSGASAAETSSTMLQLSQAFASGALMGDEFRAISESMPMLLDILAKEMGVTRGELKKLGSEGKITSDVLKSALLKATDDINTAFNNSTKTIGQSMTVLKNNMLVAFGDLDKQIKITETITKFIDDISAYWERTRAVNLVAFGEFVKSIGSFFQEGFSGIAKIIDITMNFAGEKLEGTAYDGMISWQGFLLILSNGLDAIKLAFKVMGAFITNKLTSAFYSIQINFLKLKNIAFGVSQSVGASLQWAGQNIATAFHNGAINAVNSINWIIDALNKIPGIDIDKVFAGSKETYKSYSEIISQNTAAFEKFNDTNEKISQLEAQRNLMLQSNIEATSDMINEELTKMSDKYTAFTNAQNTATKSGASLEQTLEKISNAGNNIAGGLKPTEDALKKAGKEAEKTKKELEDLQNTASNVFTKLKQQLGDQKQKVLDTSEEYKEMKLKLTELREKGSEELKKLTDRFDELKNKGQETVDGLTAKITELNKEFNKDKSQGLLQIAQRAIEAQQELDNLKNKGVDISLAKSIGEQALSQLPSTSIIGNNTVEELREVLRLEREIAFAKSQVSSDDITKAQEELNKTEAEKIADRIKEQQEIVAGKIADIETEITAERNKTIELLKEQQILIDKKTADNKKEEEDFKILMDKKKAEIVSEFNLYKSLISQKQQIENTYFSAFSQKIKIQMNEIDTTIQKMNALKEKGGLGNISLDNQSINTPQMISSGITGSNSNTTPITNSSTVNVNMGGVTVNNKADADYLAEKVMEKITRQLQLSKVGIS